MEKLTIKQVRERGRLFCVGFSWLFFLFSFFLLFLSYTHPTPSPSLSPTNRLLASKFMFAASRLFPIGPQCKLQARREREPFWIFMLFVVLCCIVSLPCMRIHSLFFLLFSVFSLVLSSPLFPTLYCASLSLSLSVLFVVALNNAGMTKRLIEIAIEQFTPLKRESMPDGREDRRGRRGS